MVGASKILTVSYGTFSCTLEGFDDPFSTMKAIAEYFRDLAADDRYFGAEPPTPDAQMLHQIAEREIQRRVEAKIQENGVILRADDSLAAEEAPPEAPAKADEETPVAALTAPEAAAATVQPPVQSESVQAEGVQAEAETIEEAAETVADESVAGESVAETAPQAVEPPVVEPPVEAATEEAPTEESAPETVAEPESPTAEAAPAQEPESVPEPEAPVEVIDLASPSESPDDSPLAEDSIAAKLLRIRAAVNHARETGAHAPSTPVSPVAPLNGLRPQLGEPEDVPEDSDYTDESPLTETAAAALAATEHAAEAEAPAEAAIAPTVAPKEDTPIEETPEETLQAVPAETEAAPEPEAVGEPETDAPAPAAQHRAAPDSTEANVGSFLSTLAEAPEADTAEEVPEAEAKAELEATSEATPEAAPEARSDEAEASQPEVAPSEVTPSEALQRPRARVIKVRRIDPALASGSATEASAEDVKVEEGPVTEAPATEAPAEEAKAEEAPATAEDADHAPEAPAEAASPAGGLSPEDEADLMAELAAVERDMDLSHDDAEPAATPAAEPAAKATPDAQEDPEEIRRADRSEGRAILETNSAGDGEAINRLMRQTETELKGPESRRRFATIAHLKAAVAATVADRKRPKDDEAESESAMRSYRDDLARVVRPRRPGAEEVHTVATRPATPRPTAPDERPAPLVLVSEQRIDHPADARPVAPIRPRRITSAAAQPIVMDEEDEDADSANLFADTGDFAEFAERIGATSLPDLLEAAAAYSSAVEGLEHFTRPQIMRFAAAAQPGEAAEDSFSREAGLRSFGQLLREGKIMKVKRGQFAISQNSRFIPEARKLAR